MKLLEGKTAVVTGAARGIGEAIALKFAEQGADVVFTYVSDSSEERAVALEQKLMALGVKAKACKSNAADFAASEIFVNDVLKEFGSLDICVNNAGISIPQPFLETTLDAFDRTMAVNARAVLLVSQIIARGMVARGEGGAIVNVSSQASSIGIADHAAYCASKGALDQLTRTMALELGKSQIRVNAVNPTVTLTPMGEMAWGDPKKSGPMLARIPLGRFAKPYHVAHAVAYLLSDKADMIHGVTLPVDGGFLAV